MIKDVTPKTTILKPIEEDIDDECKNNTKLIIMY